MLILPARHLGVCVLGKMMTYDDSLFQKGLADSINHTATWELLDAQPIHRRNWRHPRVRCQWSSWEAIMKKNMDRAQSAIECLKSCCERYSLTKSTWLFLMAAWKPRGVSFSICRKRWNDPTSSGPHPRGRFLLWNDHLNAVQGQEVEASVVRCRKPQT